MAIAPMPLIKRLATFAPALALATGALGTSPALAQDIAAGEPRPIIASNIAFFDDVEIGELSLSPVNIFYDTRCPDPELCFQNDHFAISVIMFTNEGLKEVILELFEDVRVPGGTLTLTSTGTAPSRNGAIELGEYQLEMMFQPDPVEDEGAAPESAPFDTPPADDQPAEEGDAGGQAGDEGRAARPAPLPIAAARA